MNGVPRGIRTRVALKEKLQKNKKEAFACHLTEQSPIGMDESSCTTS